MAIWKMYFEALCTAAKTVDSYLASKLTEMSDKLSSARDEASINGKQQMDKLARHPNSIFNQVSDYVDVEFRPIFEEAIKIKGMSPFPLSASFNE